MALIDAPVKLVRPAFDTQVTKLNGFLNIYDTKLSVEPLGKYYLTRDIADLDSDNRIACIPLKLSFLPNEGLNIVSNEVRLKVENFNIPGSSVDEA